MASLRRVLINVSSYCQRSLSQSSAPGLLWRSVVAKAPNSLGLIQARHISTTLAKSASKHSGTEQGVKRNSADHRRRLLAARFELRRKLYKAFCKDPDLPSEIREKNRYKLSKLPRNSAFVRIKNRKQRCIDGHYEVVLVGCNEVNFCDRPKEEMEARNQRTFGATKFCK